MSVKGQPDTNDGMQSTFRTLTWALIAATLLVPLLLLAIPAYMPIGAMYWDSYLYLDADHRIATGQKPNVDFFTPVGALEYYLFHWVRTLFPNSQPMLAASWSIILVSVPIMALLLWDIVKRKPCQAAAIAAGFALYTILPFNTTEPYPFPASDGFGIYNRHGAQLLYVLVTTLLFVQNRNVKILSIGVVMSALFMVKITAFAAGGLLCMWALIAGRVSILTAVVSVLIAAALLVPVELFNGMISAYLEDIGLLLTRNEGGLASRLIQSTSRMFGICLFAGLLALALLTRTAPGRSGLQAKLDNPFFWIGITLAAGIFYESQNTGSQELIMLWPVVLFSVLRGIAAETGTTRFLLTTGLAAAAIMPPAVQTLQHASRAVLAMVKQEPLQHTTLRSMGNVTVRYDTRHRVDDMRAHFVKFREAEVDLAEVRLQLPSYLLFSDFSYQALWAESADRAVAELNRRQADGLEYSSIMTLDFTNPFGWLTGKDVPRHITIGADPFRAIPPFDEATKTEVENTDVVLKPRCPYTDNINRIQKIYQSALTQHQEVELTPCYTAFIHPRLQEDWQ